VCGWVYFVFLGGVVLFIFLCDEWWVLWFVDD